MSLQVAFAPKDARGRFLAKTCPECGGAMEFNSGMFGNEWYCTGLVDPEDDSKPLACCEYRIGEDS